MLFKQQQQQQVTLNPESFSFSIIKLQIRELNPSRPPKSPLILPEAKLEVKYMLIAPSHDPVGLHTV